MERQAQHFPRPRGHPRSGGAGGPHFPRALRLRSVDMALPLLAEREPPYPLRVLSCDLELGARAHGPRQRGVPQPLRHPMPERASSAAGLGGHPAPKRGYRWPRASCVRGPLRRESNTTPRSLGRLLVPIAPSTGQFSCRLAYCQRVSTGRRLCVNTAAAGRRLLFPRVGGLHHRYVWKEAACRCWSRGPTGQDLWCRRVLRTHTTQRR
jgi:hypothetical protein